MIWHGMGAQEGLWNICSLRSPFQTLTGPSATCSTSSHSYFVILCCRMTRISFFNVLGNIITTISAGLCWFLCLVLESAQVVLQNSKLPPQSVGVNRARMILSTVNSVVLVLVSLFPGWGWACIFHFPSWIVHWVSGFERNSFPAFLIPKHCFIRIKNKLPHLALEGSDFLSELLQDSLLLQTC